MSFPPRGFKFLSAVFKIFSFILFKNVLYNSMHKQFDWSPLPVVRYNGRKTYWTSFLKLKFVWIVRKSISHWTVAFNMLIKVCWPKFKCNNLLVAFYSLTHSVTVLPSHITSAVHFTNPRCFILFLRNKTVLDMAVCSVQVRRLCHNWRHLPL